MSVAPASSNGSKYSPVWFSEPLNIRCSNRCAKPVRPAGSSLEPTWYQMLTATIGALRSVCTITRRPLAQGEFLVGDVDFGAGGGFAGDVGGVEPATQRGGQGEGEHAPVEGNRTWTSDMQHSCDRMKDTQPAHPSGSAGRGH